MQEIILVNDKNINLILRVWILFVSLIRFVGISVDYGDSGGGLMFFDQLKQQYYEVGLVSFKSPQFPSVTIFTNINYYVSWIKRITDEIQELKKRGTSLSR